MNNKYYKHPAFGQVYGDVLATPTGQLVWPYFAEPRDPGEPKPGWQKQPPKHEGTLLLVKGDPANEAWIAKMTQEMKNMLIVYNEGNSAKLADGLPVVRDGDDTEKFDPERYPYYVGKWIITAKNQHQPKFVSTKLIKKGVFESLAPTDFEGGMHVQFSVTPMITKGGFSYKLNSVQKIKDDGARFGGGTRDVNAVFEACNTGEVEEAPKEATQPTAPAVPAQAAVVEAKPAAKRSGLDKAAMDRL